MPHRAFASLCLAVGLLPAAAGGTLWKSGEDLRFSVSAFGLPAGEASLSARAMDNGKTVRFIARAVSSPAFQLYKIDDRIESLADAATLAPRRMDMRFSQDDDKKNHVVVYRPAQNAAEVNGETRPLSAGARDYLSALYWVRQTPLKTGRSVALTVQGPAQATRIVATPLIQERVTVPAGTFVAHKVRLLIKDESAEPAPEIHVWFTADARQMPVKAAVELPMGEFEMELVSGKGIR